MRDANFVWSSSRHRIAREGEPGGIRTRLKTSELTWSRGTQDSEFYNCSLRVMIVGLFDTDEVTIFDEQYDSCKRRKSRSSAQLASWRATNAALNYGERLAAPPLDDIPDISALRCTSGLTTSGHAHDGG